MAFGVLVLAWAALLMFHAVREFKAGSASFKFKWTYPQLEVWRQSDPVGFWLVTLAKVLIVAAIGYFGIALVLGS